jgi:hypothetical protein
MPARRFARAVKSGGAVLCLGVLLLVQTMAAAPAFHAWVHHDANDPNHECAVTLFAHGQVHSPATGVEIAQAPAVLIVLEPARSIDFVSTDVRLLPSRGPPAA